MPEEEWLASQPSSRGSNYGVNDAYLDQELPLEDLNLTGVQSLKRMEEDYSNLTASNNHTTFTHD